MLTVLETYMRASYPTFIGVGLVRLPEKSGLYRAPVRLKKTGNSEKAVLVHAMIAGRATVSDCLACWGLLFDIQPQLTYNIVLDYIDTIEVPMFGHGPQVDTGAAAAKESKGQSSNTSASGASSSTTLGSTTLGGIFDLITSAASTTWGGIFDLLTNTATVPAPPAAPRPTPSLEVLPGAQQLPDYLMPRAVTESLSSEFSPDPTSFAFWLDLTGSMAEAKTTIAHSPEGLRRLYAALPTFFDHPQMMCGGYGDCEASSVQDKYHLQASQFEIDFRSAAALDGAVFQGGGGNDAESVHAAWFWAAFKTNLSSWTQGKLGVLVTMGDEPTHPYYTAEGIRKAYPEYDGPSYSNPELLAEVSRLYKFFHIVVLNATAKKLNSIEKWQDLLGDRVYVVDGSRPLDVIGVIVEKILPRIQREGLQMAPIDAKYLPRGERGKPKAPWIPPAETVFKGKSAPPFIPTGKAQYFNMTVKTATPMPTARGLPPAYSTAPAPTAGDYVAPDVARLAGNYCEFLNRKYNLLGITLDASSAERVIETDTALAPLVSQIDNAALTRDQFYRQFTSPSFPHLNFYGDRLIRETFHELATELKSNVGFYNYLAAKYVSLSLNWHRPLLDALILIVKAQLDKFLPKLQDGTFDNAKFKKMLRNPFPHLDFTKADTAAAFNGLATELRQDTGGQFDLAYVAALRDIMRKHPAFPKLNLLDPLVLSKLRYFRAQTEFLQTGKLKPTDVFDPFHESELDMKTIDPWSMSELIDMIDQELIPLMSAQKAKAREASAVGESDSSSTALRYLLASMFMSPPSSSRPASSAVGTTPSTGPANSAEAAGSATAGQNPPPYSADARPPSFNRFD